MHERTEFPYQVREIEHLWIPLSDGIRLAARIWMPEDAPTHPVPAILELIPYRKQDFTAIRDARNHRWFAGHGYACIRVDMRGSGDSEGVLLDEYLEREQDDGVEVVRWLRSRPWCDGKVGMFGISWGGFNGLQIAARQPEGLDAVVSVASTDDRYADDVHYMGGCLLGDNLSWASVMFAYNASPPDPRTVGGKWKEMWMERMEKSGLWVLNWLKHQTRDDFWKHGSVCEDFGRIKAPVLAVSGWADGYSNAVFRLVEGLGEPSRGLVGPWSHKYPHHGVPGPAIGFLQECLRWWDQWLKGKDTGVTREPRIRAWMQDRVPPSTRYHRRPGRWVGESDWPSGSIRVESWRLLPGNRMAARANTDEPRHREESCPSVQSPLSVGQFAGKWCSYSAAPDLPGDQREEDGGSLYWESPPLAEPVEVLGAVRARLRVRTDGPDGMVAIRLSDVAGDGKATRVSYGLLNLTHRNGHEHPEPLVPGQGYDIVCTLNHCGHRFPSGHRLRISLSTSLWPLAWPPPRPVRVAVDTEKSDIAIPIREPAEADARIGFADPEEAESPPVTVLRPPESHWKVERDLGVDQVRMHVFADGGKHRLDECGLVFSRNAREEYGFQGDDFTSAYGETIHEREWEHDGWHVSIRGRTRMYCDEKYFYVEADLDAWEDGRRVFCRSWQEKVRRNLV